MYVVENKIQHQPFLCRGLKPPQYQQTVRAPLTRAATSPRFPSTTPRSHGTCGGGGSAAAAPPRCQSTRSPRRLVVPPAASRCVWTGGGAVRVGDGEHDVVAPERGLLEHLRLRGAQRLGEALPSPRAVRLDQKHLQQGNVLRRAGRLHKASSMTDTGGHGPAGRLESTLAGWCLCTCV